VGRRRNAEVKHEVKVHWVAVSGAEITLLTSLGLHGNREIHTHANRRLPIGPLTSTNLSIFMRKISSTQSPGVFVGNSRLPGYQMSSVGH